MKRRCQDTFRGDRCELPADPAHDRHRRGSHTWGFTDGRPEWLRRADADFRARGYVAAKALDPA